MRSHAMSTDSDTAEQHDRGDVFGLGEAAQRNVAPQLLVLLGQMPREAEHAGLDQWSAL
jgi:hypothetical protein